MRAAAAARPPPVSRGRHGPRDRLGAERERAREGSDVVAHDREELIPRCDEPVRPRALDPEGLVGGRALLGEELGEGSLSLLPLQQELLVGDCVLCLEHLVLAPALDLDAPAGFGGGLVGAELGVGLLSGGRQDATRAPTCQAHHLVRSVLDSGALLRELLVRALTLGGEILVGLFSPSSALLIVVPHEARS